jgi:hypothetical protein
MLVLGVLNPDLGMSKPEKSGYWGVRVPRTLVLVVWSPKNPDLGMSKPEKSGSWGVRVPGMPVWGV